MNRSISWWQSVESFRFAINSLKINRLRTFLSLLGITIGIFAIISVLTVVSSLEKNIRDGIDALGDDIVYVQKWPWGGDGEYPWWDYMKRPLPTLHEYQYLKKSLQGDFEVAFAVSTRTQLNYANKVLDAVAVMAVSEGYDGIRSFELAQGRYFSAYETQAGSRAVVLGAELAKALFEGQSPTDREVQLAGQRLRVIGVFEKEGSSIIDTSLDNVALIPLNLARTFLNLRSESINPLIMVKPKADQPAEVVIGELEGLMRSYRKLKPVQESNFALNKTSVISQSLDGLFVVLDSVGWLIGGFSILVGGFGIANIMFVSVKEQTKLIGIQKALGAKRFFILFQFLSEAILLSLLGGLIGLFFVFLLASVVSRVTDFALVLNAFNVVLGLIISLFIGVVSGIVPALQAARLDPVVAISQN